MSEATLIWLRPTADRGALDALAAELAWTLQADDERAHTLAATRSWIVGEAPAGGGEPPTAGWRENHVLGVRAAWAPPGDLEARVRAALPHFTRDELLSAAQGQGQETTPAEALPALRVLTLMERQAPSAELLALFSRWMTYAADGAPPARFMRRAVMNLCWIGRWPALLPLIEARAQDDSELAEEWRQLAAELQGAGADKG